MIRTENKIVYDLRILKQYTLNKYINSERTNRYIASKAKKAATNYCLLETLKVMREGVQFDWPCKLKCDWYTDDERIDADNWEFAIKFIQDGMQNATYKGVTFLPNDGRKFITGHDHDLFVDKKNPRVEIYPI